MIENKTVTIVKNNTFDKGWTLFEPFDCGLAINRAYRELKLSDVVRAITYADEVNVVLCEACLSSRIVAELQWANKHLKLNAVVKSKDLTSAYPQLHFNSVVVDPTVNFNYVGVTGRQNVRALYTDAFCQTDDTVEKVYFRNQRESTSFDFLQAVKTVFFTDKDGSADYSTLIEQAQKHQCNVYYVVPTTRFNRKVFDMAKGCGIQLLASDFVGSGVLLVNDNNELSELNVLKGGVYLTSPTRDSFSYFGKLFRCCMFDDELDSSKLAGNYYTCFKGNLEKLNVAPSRLIEIDVPVALMEDFVKERFDKSICDKHNDYSAVAKQVEYRFTLTPPVMGEGFVEAHLYDGIHSLAADWQKLQKLDFAQIRSDYCEILKQDYGLLKCFDEAQQFGKKLTVMTKAISYGGYYALVNAAREIFGDVKARLLDVCAAMCGEIYSSHSAARFDKFDTEIEGYRQTVAEKTLLIEQGVEVLSNKRRVEVLTKKINDLLELKHGFEGSAAEQVNKQKTEFVALCKSVLDGSRIVKPSTVGVSLENVVKVKQKPEEKLEAFVEKYLIEVNDYLQNCISVLDELAKEKIPETYPVYEKDGQRYVAIDDENEYEQTLATCKEFNILCLARR